MAQSSDTEVVFRVDVSQLVNAGNVINATAAAGARASNSFNQLQTAVGNTNRAVRSNNQALVNTSYQLQDMAVQLSSGTSLFTAFAQQAPQLFSVFGTAGAIAGTITAVAMALGGPFIRAALEGKDAVKLLGDQVERTERIFQETDGIYVYTEALTKLKEQSQGAFMATVNLELIKIEKSLKEAREPFQDLIGDLEDLKEANIRTAGGRGGAYLSEEGKQFAKLSAELDIFAKTASKSKAPLIDLSEQLNDIFNRFADLKGSKLSDEFVNLQDKVLEATSSIRELEEKRKILQEQIKSPDILADFNEAKFLKDHEDMLVQAQMLNEEFGRKTQEKLNDQIQKEIDAEQKKADKVHEIKEKQFDRLKDMLARQVDAIIYSHADELTQIKMRYEREREIVDQAMQVDLANMEFYKQLKDQLNQNEEDDRRDAQWRQIEDQRAIDEMRFGMVADSATRLTDLMQKNQDENSDQAKIGFAIAQALAVTQQIMHANTAYAAVMASASTFPGGAAAAMGQAEFVRGMLYANAAMTAGLAIGDLSARRQGGNVSPGRSYLVGEEGPEILRMGKMAGEIIPNHKLGGGSSSVTTNVIINNAPEGTTVSKSRTKLDDRSFVENIVVDILSNPSHRGRTGLHRTSNVMPRGSM